jgi:GTP:adenosylcobinamide-phosphate guanylyltransferase
VDAVVMAAGEGRRLRPVTERWAKAVLPIDGRPVVATLLRELAAAELERVWVVVGHLREQVELLVGDGSAFGLDVRIVRQPSVRGSADAVARAVDEGVQAPFIVTAADTVFRSGDVGIFARTWSGSGADGAIAVRRLPPPGPGRSAVRLVGGIVERVRDDDPGNPFSAAPLWGLGRAIVGRLCRDREPFELENAFQLAVDSGAGVVTVEIGKTRDLTDPLDLVEQNFPYLGA